jgi:hypothetical protein
MIKGCCQLPVSEAARGIGLSLAPQRVTLPCHLGPRLPRRQRRWCACPPRKPRQVGHGDHVLQSRSGIRPFSVQLHSMLRFKIFLEDTEYLRAIASLIARTQHLNPKLQMLRGFGHNADSDCTMASVQHVESIIVVDHLQAKTQCPEASSAGVKRKALPCALSPDRAHYQAVLQKNRRPTPYGG